MPVASVFERCRTLLLHPVFTAACILVGWLGFPTAARADASTYFTTENVSLAVLILAVLGVFVYIALHGVRPVPKAGHHRKRLRRRR